MGLDLYFFKKDINIQEVRDNISNLYDKLRLIQEEIEQLEDVYDDAKLADVSITHNLNPTCSYPLVTGCGCLSSFFLSSDLCTTNFFFLKGVDLYFIA